MKLWQPFIYTSSVPVVSGLPTTVCSNFELHVLIRVFTLLYTLFSSHLFLVAIMPVPSLSLGVAPLAKLAVLSFLTTKAVAQYQLQESWSGATFFDYFDFYTVSGLFGYTNHV